jgi:hypothetical protein
VSDHAGGNFGVHAVPPGYNAAVWNLLLRMRAVIVAIAISGLGLSTGALRRSAHEAAPPAVNTQIDVPAIPGEVAGPLAFGFRSLVADATFLEAIQLLAIRKTSLPSTETIGLDRTLTLLLTYSTEMDPKFAGAYRFAGYALPHETVDGKAMGVLAAVSLLERGVRERPDDWTLSLTLGFLQSYYLHDFRRASRTLALAAKTHGAPPYLALLATRVGAQAGDLETATSMAELMLAQANEDRARREWEERVEALHMERDLQAIDAAVQRYRSEHGAPPRSLQMLVAAGYLRGVPREPHGGAYVIDGDGTARSTAAERLRVYGGPTTLEVH